MTIINKAADKDEARGDWELILSWCILAAQQEMNGNSLLGLSMDTVTKGNDEYFATWINQWLDLTFGPCPSTGPQGNMGVAGIAHPCDPMQVSAMMAMEVEKGVVLGLRAVSHLQRDTP